MNTDELWKLLKEWRQEAVKHPHSGLHAYNNCADQLQAALDAQAGMVMVPKVPTMKMVDAGENSIVDGARNRPEMSWHDETKLCWAAMLAAAAEPVEGGE